MSTILTLHDPQIARRHYADGHWRSDTLYSLLRQHAGARPEAYALRDSRKRVTWQTLAQWTDAVAADLHEAGLRRGQRVSVWLPNRVEAVVVLLACSRNGYVCNPSLHQNYTVREIVQLMERIQSAALFAQPGYGADANAQDVFAAARALSAVKRVYALEPFTASASMPGDCAAFPAPDDSYDTPAPDDNPDKIVYLAFTSGTTGTPKGVLHSDNTLLANGRAMVHDWHHDERTVLYTPQSAFPPHRHRRTGTEPRRRLRNGCERSAAGHEAARLDTRNRRDVRDGRAHARDGHPRGHEGPRPIHARRSEDLLHGGLDHSARDGTGISRHGCEAAEHLRHDRERLAPVHAAG